MEQSVDSRLDVIESKVERLEQRFSDLFSKLIGLKESTDRTVEKMAKIAAAAESMSDSTRKLLAEKEVVHGRYIKH